MGGVGGETAVTESLLEAAGNAAATGHGLKLSEVDALKQLLRAGGWSLAGELPRDALAALYAAKLVRYEVRSRCAAPGG